MKGKNCPHCQGIIPVDRLMSLKGQRAINCSWCAKPVRVNQGNITLAIVFVSALTGIFSKQVFNTSYLDLFIIMSIFGACYTVIHLKLIGLFFSLEKADDDDLLQ